MKTNTNELLQAAIAEHNNYRPSSEAERVAAEEWRNEQRRDAYLYRRDSYERAACVMDDYDSGPDWRQAEEIEEQRWHEEHEEHGNDEH